jgi:CubicO group peptidase (beta-lactamase class C family)
MKKCAALFCAFAVLATAGRAADSAAYAGLEADRFMTRWLVLGPIPIGDGAAPDEARQQRAFADDLLRAAGGETAVQPAPKAHAQAGGKDLRWRVVSSSSDIVDLEGTKNAFAVAYAWAEIDMPKPARAVLGIGSDDGIKVWINGTLAHEKWIGRGVRPDEDLVGIDLRQGRNQVLLKIQNIQADWGFACRPLGPQTLTTRLITAAHAGDLDAATLLLDLGAPIDGRGLGGLTALQAAKLHGRQTMVDLLLSKGADGQAAIPARDTLVDALLRESFKPDGPAAAVLVARDGQVLFERAYGRSDIEHSIAAQADTKFRIGSVTKQFTAAAILKLQEQGKLSLDDTLSKYLPDFPRGGEVTLRHLLTHTSGIHNYTSKPDFNATVTQPTTPERHIESFKNDPYDFGPGERWLYSNSGYFLLGYIVQKVSGQSYGDYLRQTFFIPLGMSNTGVHERTGALPHEALGYAAGGKTSPRVVDWSMSRAGGAGALYSTVHDLYLWNEAVFGGKVLKEESLRAAWTPVITSDEDPSQPKDTGYGYGWSIQRLRGAREISHGGGLPGFTSHLLRLPESRLTVAVLINALPAPADAGMLAHDIAELYAGDTLPAHETPKLDPSVSSAALDAVVGDYDMGGTMLTVTRSGRQMFAQIAGQARNEMFPRSETAFFLKERDREIAFVKNAKGAVTKAVLTNATGFNVTATRQDTEHAAPVDPKTYDAYVGRYDYRQAVMTVTREGQQLFAQLGAQPKFEIFPRSETVFFWKVVKAEITFVKDASGAVVKGIHSQGGQTFDVPRIK